MDQIVIMTECISENDKQTFIVRLPNGKVLKVCDSLDSYNQFCIEFFVEPKNEKQDEGKK